MFVEFYQLYQVYRDQAPPGMPDTPVKRMVGDVDETFILDVIKRNYGVDATPYDWERFPLAHAYHMEKGMMHPGSRTLQLRSMVFDIKAKQQETQVDSIIGSILESYRSGEKLDQKVDTDMVREEDVDALKMKPVLLAHLSLPHNHDDFARRVASNAAFLSGFKSVRKATAEAKKIPFTETIGQLMIRGMGPEYLADFNGRSGHAAVDPTYSEIGRIIREITSLYYNVNRWNVFLQVSDTAILASSRLIRKPVAPLLVGGR